MKKASLFLIFFVLLIPLFISCAQDAVDADNTGMTGYPSDEIGQPQMMYDNRIYYYRATGFDEALPEGYEFVGKVAAVDNKNPPTENFNGCQIEVGQEIYISSSDAVIIFLKYSDGYARFTADK